MLVSGRFLAARRRIKSDRLNSGNWVTCLGLHAIGDSLRVIIRSQCQENAPLAIHNFVCVLVRRVKFSRPSHTLVQRAGIFDPYIGPSKN